jgi:hypothetical protein
LLACQESRPIKSVYLIFFAALAAHAEPLRIENETLRVVYDPQATTFAVQSKQISKTFLTAGQTLGLAGNTRIKSKRLIADNAQLWLEPRQPFVFLSSSIRNAGAEAIVTNHVRRPVLFVFASRRDPDPVGNDDDAEADIVDFLP